MFVYVAVHCSMIYVIALTEGGHGEWFGIMKYNVYQVCLKIKGMMLQVSYGQSGPKVTLPAGRTDRQTDRRTDRRADRRTDGRTDR